MTEFDTLAEAREWLREQVRNKGARCPCCRQNAKIYKRSINSAMAGNLLRLYRVTKHNLNGDVWFDVKFITESKYSSGGDFSKLRYWGLIEEQINTDTKKKNAGFWRITDRGRYFVEGKVSIPKYAKIYDSQFLKFDGKELYFKDCFKESFDYATLMNGVGGDSNTYI